MNAVDIQLINYHSVSNVVSNICTILSRRYKAQSKRKIEHDWNVQLRNLGYQDFNSLWGYKSNPSMLEVDMLLRALMQADLAEDQPTHISREYIPELLFQRYSRPLYNAFYHAFGIELRQQDTTVHVQRLLAENWFDLPTFKSHLIENIISERLEATTQEIYRRFFATVGDQFQAWQQLREEINRRWPHLRSEPILPNMVTDFLNSWVRQTESISKQYV